MSHEARERAAYATMMLQSDVFADALTQIRTDALVALASIDPADTIGIIRNQVTAQVAVEIVDRLKATIASAGGMDGGYDQNSEEE